MQGLMNTISVVRKVISEGELIRIKLSRIEI